MKVVLHFVKISFDPYLDLSAETLLKGETSESFHRRLALLFKTNDLDGSGDLDLHEFSSCLKGLNLGLSDGEIESLYAFAAGTSSSGEHLSFDDFASFVSEILIELVREKRLRTMEVKHRGRYLRASVVQRLIGKADILRAAYTERVLAAGQCSPTIGYAAVEEILRSSPFELRGTTLDILMMEVSSVEEESIIELSAVHGAILEGLSNSNWSEREPEYRKMVQEYMAHPLFIKNTGVDIMALQDSLSKVEIESDRHGTPRRKICMQALCRAHVRRTEANYMLRQLSPPHNGEDVFKTPTTDDLENIWRSAYELNTLRGLCEFHSSSEMLEVTLALLEKEVVRGSGGTKAGLHGKSDSGLSSVSLKKCISILEDIRILGLSRREVLHALFTMDSQDIESNVTKLKKLARAAVDTAVLVRGIDFLINSQRVLDVLADQQSKILRGLTEKGLTEWLEGCLPPRDSEDGIFVSERLLTKLLPCAPSVCLGEKESLIIVAMLPSAENGLLHRDTLDLHLFDSICKVRWSRTFARRFQLLTSSHSDEVHGQNQTNLHRLAERLLNSIKLENWNGNVRITFPDVHTRLLQNDASAEEQRERTLRDDTVETKTYTKEIRVIGNQVRMVPARISTSFRASMKGMSAASTLTVVVKAEGLPELQLGNLSVPSLAIVDEDAADELLGIFLNTLVIENREGEGSSSYQLTILRG